MRLAYAIHGSGPPLVVASCWLSHLQYDWQSPVWRHFLDQLGAIATVVRYDERGFGLSDWTVDDFSLPARLADLEAVVAAAGIERFALLGMSGGSAVAMAYAIAHPERVSRLILYGTVCGEPVVFSPDELAEEETYRSMIRVGWAKEDPEFRRVFTMRFIPGATEEQLRWFDDLQRMSTSADERGRQPDRPPAGGHRGRPPEDLGADDRAPGDRRPSRTRSTTRSASPR